MEQGAILRRENANLSLILACAVLLILSGCVNPTIVNERSIEDESLSCLQLRDQSNQLNELKSSVESGKGVSGANAAMFVMFWPGIFFNEGNSNKALEAISRRQAVLADLYVRKNCGEEE